MAATLSTLHAQPQAPSRQPVKERVGAAEWEQRVALAACYRLAAAHRMTDLIYTHISARVPGPEEHFLINAYGLMFDEITASSLVKVNLAGDIIEDETGLGINPAGFVIHSAIHGARHDVQCVMHTHTRDGLAVAAQEHGLLPLTQHAMRYWNRVAYHDYEGVALEMDEQQRLVADLGDKSVMILRNHGLLTVGASVRQAFDHMYYMERACQAQIAAMSGGAALRIPPPEVSEKVAQQFERPDRAATTKDWPALLRMLDRTDASYKQ